MSSYGSNRSKPKEIQEEAEDIEKFTVMLPEDNEKINIPIEPNLLNFYEQEVNDAYAKSIYLDKSERKISEQLYLKILIFYLYLTIVSCVYIVFIVTAYNKNELKVTYMIFHVACNCGILLLSYCLLFLVYYPKLYYKLNRLGYSILGLIVYSYYIIGNQIVLSSIFAKETTNYDIPLNLGLIGFSIMLRYILCDHFLSILVVSFVMIMEYVLSLIIVSGSYSLENLNNFFVILIFIVLQIIDTQQVEYKLKKKFWFQYKDEKNYKASLTAKDEEDAVTFHTETELLVQTCDKIKKVLKKVCSVIIFKDVKSSLKLAQVELDHLKFRIGRGAYKNEVKIEQEADIDADDKEFISQNFIEVSYMTPERSAVTDLTMFEFKEKKESFPFSHYGIDKLESILSQLGKNWSFDIWFVYNSTGHSISIVGKYLFSKWELNEFLGTQAEVSDELFESMENGYLKNPYHNACHASDVLHTTIFFLLQSDLSKSCNQLDIVSVIVSSLGHDLGHPALTNRFLVNNKDKIAIRYNDSSVLENMHSAKTFQLLSAERMNILSKLSNDDWLKSRKMIVEMILETDMSRHFEILGKFRTRAISLSNIDITIFEDKCQVLGMGLKCADIGHSAKDFQLHEMWSMLVCEEFFNQGDIEKQKGQSVSMYCDRKNTDISKSQAGFIKNICIPLYETWCFYLKSEIVEKFALNQLKKNFEFWISKKKRRSTVISEERKLKFDTLKRIQSTR